MRLELSITTLEMNLEGETAYYARSKHVIGTLRVLVCVDG